MTSDILSVAVSAAGQAASFLQSRFGQDHRIEAKGDRNFVTDVDKQAQRMIIDAVRGRFPGHDILAEEDDHSAAAHCSPDNYLWIIDPLDGTHNFIRNNPCFGVSIGICHKGAFVCGVINMPISAEVYVAEKGGGAFKNGQPIRVSGRAELRECSLSYDSALRSDPPLLAATLQDLAKHTFNVRMFGSSARALSYLAEGVVDACVEFEDMPWDFAAGVCLIEQAQGTVTDLLGRPVTHSSMGYVAANPRLQPQLLSIVRSHTGR